MIDSETRNERMQRAVEEMPKHERCMTYSKRFKDQDEAYYYLQHVSRQAAKSGLRPCSVLVGTIGKVVSLTYVIQRS